MNNIIIKDDIRPRVEELLNLYEDIEWSAYTNDPLNLKLAIDSSLKVWTSWDDDKLIGLARAVGDGHTIIYIQDILVLKSYQGQGIGSKLIKLILEKYKSVRQIVLMTDETEKTIEFYKKNGLKKASDYEMITFIK
jgi:ribosomal protein S18 acetylase RimI-like enzyme